MTDAALLHLQRTDKVLGRLISQVGPCSLRPKKRSPFEALVQAITYQQLNGTAASTILRRVKALYPSRRFPTPVDLLATPPERLRAAGLSRAKTAAIHDLAAKTLAGVVPTPRAITTMADAEIVERLIVVRGVGPWTVEMFLIFTLGRPDVLPVTDYAVRKGFAQIYRRKELPTHAELLEYGERWRPHRTTAAWYLWRALELPQSAS